MEYRSTRGSETTRRSAEAIIQGIAEDRGLYVPTKIPALDVAFESLIDLDYRQVAEIVLSKFYEDFTKDEIQFCVANAYDDKFSAEEIVPVVSAGNAFFLELYHGKTAAFKDMALSILPYLLTTAMDKENEKKKIAILTATSGDTGKAALEGFSDVPGTEIIVFYPKEGVSLIQERQMTTQEGSNTHVYGIQGNFDDAQSGVKAIFADSAMAEKLNAAGYRLSSANSINIGRLVPQVVYYVWGYIQLIRQGIIHSGEEMNVVVPTGNFGNILSAYYAKNMGVPIANLVCASNKNNVLTDFLNTGVYDVKRPFYVTSSPSMDILISSNLERLLYHLSGEDGSEITSLMEALEKDRTYSVSDKIKSGLDAFYGGFAEEDETLDTLAAMYQEHGYLMDTHTAVGYKVYQDYRTETGDLRPTLIAATASAYKFSDSVARALGMSETMTGFAALKSIADRTGVPVPESLQGLSDRPIRHLDVIETSNLKDVVLQLLLG